MNGPRCKTFVGKVPFVGHGQGTVTFVPRRQVKIRFTSGASTFSRAAEVAKCPRKDWMFGFTEVVSLGPLVVTVIKFLCVV